MPSSVVQDATASPLQPDPIAVRESRWIDWLPGVQMLRNYQLGWIRNDVVAGIVLSTMLVPVGIAYAVASGVPAINGLYATIIPLLAYALFGPSRSSSSVRILHSRRSSSASSCRLPPATRRAPSRIAGAMSIVAGAVCIVAGIARLGFITELLSKPIRYGYMNGIALAVLISQLPKLFGFSDRKRRPPARPVGYREAILQTGKRIGPAAALGGGTLVLILVLKAHKRMGAILLAVIAAMAAAAGSTCRSVTG